MMNSSLPPPHVFIQHWTQQLQREFEGIVFHYRLRLNKPIIHIEDMGGKWGLWLPHIRTIRLSWRLIRQYPWDVVLEILKHEMAHMMVDELHHEPAHGHGDLFKECCRRLGMSVWAMSAAVDLGQPLEIKSESALDDKQEQLLRRTQKLLALAESAEEHEAALAMQRVRELYEKYNLEALAEGRREDYTYHIINHRLKVVPQHQSMIAQILQQHFFVEVIFSQQYDPEDLVSHKILEIMGTPQNVAMAEYVYHFLWDSLPRLWQSYQRQKGAQSKTRRSYYLGVLTGFDEKLKQRHRGPDTPRQEPPPSTGLPVEIHTSLAMLNERLQDYLCYRHPRIVTRRWGGTSVDGGSFAAGKQAGRDLALHQPLTGSSQNRTKTMLLEGGRS